MANIAVFLAGICVLYSNAQNVPVKQNEICLTKDCVKVAARVIENMDENADPCDDFYKFACGGFEEKTFIQPSEIHVSQMSKLREKVLEKLVSLFEESPDPEEPEIFESVRNLYKSCMDVEDIEKNSLNDLMNILEHVGGFPVVKGNNWNESEYNLIDVALKLESLGLKGSIFVELNLEVDYRRELKEVDLGIPRENVLKGEEDNIVQAHLKYLIDMAKLLGASSEAAEKEMREVLDLKLKIGNIESLSRLGYKKLREIPNIYTNINWMDLIQNKSNNANLSPSSVGMGDMDMDMNLDMEMDMEMDTDYDIDLDTDYDIDLDTDYDIDLDMDYDIDLEILMDLNQNQSNNANRSAGSDGMGDTAVDEYYDDMFEYDYKIEKTEIQIEVSVSESYLNKLKEILSNTSARVLANYQISESIPMTKLTEKALTILDTYKRASENKTEENKIEREPRWKMCLRNVGDFGKKKNFYHVGLRIATSAMYVRKYFNNETKLIINDMIENVIEEFDIIIKQIDWMDEETRNKTYKLVHDLKLYIGYAKDLTNNTIIDEFYNGIQFSPRGFLKNKLKMSTYFTKKYSDIGTSKYWSLLALSDEVNAFYFPDDIVFLSAAIIGGAMFDPNWPLYMKYGAFGLVISHEITHAIDLHLDHFWHHNSHTSYVYWNKTICVIDEYGNYTFVVDGEKVHVDGEKTKRENIADIIGNRIAYRSYQKQSSSLQEGVLPGLPFSQNQLFWLSEANAYCSKNRPEFILLMISKYSHSPEKFRINGPFSNLEEFSKDWKCPLGSKMNPAEKCHVW